MKEIDLMSIGSYTELPGGNIALPQGYSSVLAPIIRNIPPENILKQHPITSIQWRWGEDKEEEEVSDAESDCSVNTVKSVEREEALDTGQLGMGDIKGLCQASLPASVVSSRIGSRRGSGDMDPATRRSGKPAVKVECDGGKVFYADQVICTMPLGVSLSLNLNNQIIIVCLLCDLVLGLIQNNPDTFDPPLPKEKQESASKLVFGTVNKIFLSYDAPFLNPEISEIITLWNKVDENAVPMEQRWFRKIYSFCKGLFAVTLQIVF